MTPFDRSGGADTVDDTGEEGAPHGDDWRVLFQSLHEGYIHCEMVYGPGGEAVDFRFLEVNDNFERLTGIPAADVRGRLLSEAVPGLEPFWLETYARVAETGEPAHVEYLASPLEDRWFEARAYRTAPGRFVSLFLNISDRKRAEREIGRFKAFSDHSDDAHLMLNGEGRLVYANPAALRSLGYAEGELRSLCVTDFDPLWSTERFRTFLTAASRGPVPAFESLHRRKDGSVYPVEITVTVVTEDDERFLLAIARDISARRRVESLRAAQNRLLELTVKDTPLGEALEGLLRTVEAYSPAEMHASILLLDDDGVHLRHGAAPSLPEGFMAAIDGMAIGPAAGCCGAAAYTRAPVGAFDIATDPRWADFRDLALAHGVRACWSTPILSGDKVLGAFAMYYPEPREPDEADLELVEAVTRSATLAIEHKRAETALRQSRAEMERQRRLYEAILTNTPDLAFVWGLDHRFIYANETLLRMWGVTREAAIGKHLLELGYEPWHAALHDREIEQVIATREPVRGEVPFEGAFGRRMYDYILVPVIGADGKVEAVAGTTRDVTEYKQAQAALARHRDELEQRVGERTRELQDAQARLAHAQRMEALGQLAGGIAHDFNNVLQAVQGGASLIERRPADPEGVSRLARMVFDAAERGAAITRRLLAFSRRGDLRAEPVDPAALLGGLSEVLTHTLGAGIAVQVEAPAGLPPLLADKGQLETVLVNLATNGRDAMGGNGRLTLAAEVETVADGAGPGHPANLEAGAYLRLSVTDTGAGMTPEVLARATDPFFTTKGQAGTGLGLAMARGFAEQSGGGLSIESAPGRGATIRLWFPMAAEAPVEASTGDQPAAAGGAQKRTVLLVDDEPLVREVLAEQLEAAGYAVRAAADGAAALALLDSGAAVDLLVSDLSMPGMDGVAVVREMQQRRPKLPAILLTGFATHAAEIAIGRAVSGAFTLLRKPVEGKVLAERVAVMLEGRGSGSAGAE